MSGEITLPEITIEGSADGHQSTLQTGALMVSPSALTHPMPHPNACL